MEQIGGGVRCRKKRVSTISRCRRGGGAEIRLGKGSRDSELLCNGHNIPTEGGDDEIHAIAMERKEEEKKRSCESEPIKDTEWVYKLLCLAKPTYRRRRPPDRARQF